tara:strand:+ start:448 stop:933 length:486 start_codon:yes stop_codon:yes gene_type:complete
MIILCLTGTNPYPFDRLVTNVDIELGPANNVIIQLGNSYYTPKHSKSFNFCERDEIFKLINNADIVISQGGYGSMTDVLNFKKPLIAVPRYKDQNESQDNQKELVDYFAQKGYAIPCYKIENLKELVKKASKDEFKLLPYKAESNIKISRIIEEFIKINKN